MAGMKGAVEVAALLGSTPAPAQPSPQLRRRILASVGIERRGFMWAPMWAAAAACCLGVAIYYGLQQRHFADQAQLLRNELRSQNTQLTSLREAFSILNQPETQEASFGNAQPKPPRGKVFVSPSQGVLLMASNLPPAPSGKMYEMWVIPKAGKPVPAGLFQSEVGGTAMYIRRGPVDLVSTGAVAVTLEDARGADQPTSQPLIVAALANLPVH